MSSSRRVWIGFLAATLLSLFGCAGPPSTLRALGKPTGGGPAHLEVDNQAGATIHELYMAPHEQVNEARAAGVEPGSADDLAMWGEDLLDRAGLPEGKKVTVGDVEPGRYDVLVLDADRREQFVRGLRLKAGGKYLLILNDSGWQLPR